MQKQHDIVIIGAGMVGLCVANLLAELPLSIAIVEAYEVHAWKAEDYSLRVSAVSAASQQTLDKACAWLAIKESRISNYTDMRIWEQAIDAVEALHFSSDDVGSESLGCIVENALIRSALKSSLDTQENQKVNTKTSITWYCPDKLLAIEVCEAHADVHLQSGTNLKSKLVIAADGANSVTRNKLNLPEVSRSYSQYGVVAQLKTEKPHQQTAYQRFHDQDVLGILPLASGDCSMVWSCSEIKAQSLLKLSDEQMGDKITEFSQGVLGSVSVIRSAQAFPLQLLHSRQYVIERVVLCGDAAHAVHPLAGQGLNLGLLDAAVLADVLIDAWKANYDLGDLSLLRQYERKRKGNNVKMMTLMDSLLAVFHSSNPVLEQARRVGMGLVNKVQPIKNTLIKQALGLKSL